MIMRMRQWCFGLLALVALWGLSGLVFVPTARAEGPNAVLGVTRITAVQTYANPDGTFANGWHWVFDVTVPFDETVLQMKFADWTNGSATIPAAGNIRFYSEQSSNANSGASAIVVQAAGEYGGELYLNPILGNDLDTFFAGRQIRIFLEARIPAGSAGGSYSTSYGIKTSADTVAPVLTLKGTSPVTVERATSYTDEGATATDNVDGDLTSKIVLSGTVIVNVAGDYTLTYNVKDTAGNSAAPVSRVVQVRDTIKPVITIGEYIKTPTNQDIVVTASTNEGSLNETSHTFTENGSFTFTATDASGNSVSETVTITNIDKAAPTATVSYSTTAPTNKDVVATITPSEEVTITSQGGSSHTFAGNHTFTFTFVDKAGNTGSVDAVVNNIDKEAPVISLGAYPTGPTNQNITVTATTNEGTLNAASHLFDTNGTFEFVATDAAGNVTKKSVNINNIDKELPTLTITGATSGESDLPGTLAGGYVLNTENGDGSHLVQFKSGTVASENLKADVFGLNLVPAPGQTAELVKYYSTKPAEYQTYLNAAAAGTQPFAYIKGNGTTAVRLLDGAQYYLGGYENDMVVPDNFPLGTYTVTGKIVDLAGNETSVTFKLIVAGSLTVPTAHITYAPNNTDPTNQSVVATLVPDKPEQEIQVTNNGGKFTYSFTQNDSFTFEFESKGRAKGTAKAEVNNIDKVKPSVVSLKLNGDTKNVIANPVKNPVGIEITASENVDWASVQVENIVNATLDKVFQDGASCLDGTSFCSKVWKGELSGGTPLVDGNYRIKVNMKDAAGNVFDEYISAPIITVDTTAPVIKLTGDNPLTVGVGTAYVEPGAVAEDAVDGNFAATASDTVDTAVIKDYIVTYTATDKSGNVAVPVTRTVKVADITAPALTITGFTDNGQTMGGNEAAGYLLPTLNKVDVNHELQFAARSQANEALAAGPFGLKLISTTVAKTDLEAYYKARIPDDSDAGMLAYRDYLIKGLSGTKPFAYIQANAGNELVLLDAAQLDLAHREKGMIIPDNYPLGEYVVKGEVADIYGNKTPVTLKLVIIGDRVKPVITVNGSHTVYVVVGTEYHDAGASAMDETDGSVAVQTESTVIHDVIGEYTVTYTATDKAGNTATAARRVNVVAATHDIKIDFGTGGTINKTVQTFDSITFEIVPNEDYHVVNVFVDGVPQGPIPRYTFQSVVGSHTLSATFAMNTPSATFVFSELDSMQAGQLDQFTIKVADVKYVSDSELLRYKAVVKKSGAPLAGLKVWYPEADSTSDPQTWPAFVTDVEGVAYFGPATGFPLSMLPALKTSTGITTPFVAALETGSYSLQVSIVNASTMEELVASQTHHFTVNAE